MKISEHDIKVIEMIRYTVDFEIKNFAMNYDLKGKTLLDIAPQDYVGAKKYFKHSSVKTLDIDSSSGADYIADICKCNSHLIPDDFFDLIVCTEVLEHTLRPFDAASELYRIIKKGGMILITTPFDFRIHGPLPDCWRFTDYGLRALFRDFSEITIKAIENPDRNLMPLQYVTILSK